MGPRIACRSRACLDTQIRERRLRLLPVLTRAAALLTTIAVLRMLWPRSEVPMEVWAFRRAQDFFSVGGFIAMTAILSRCEAAWKAYDLVAFLWGCHLLTHVSCTCGQTERLLGLESTTGADDEALQLLICLCFIACFLTYLETEMPYLVALLHVHVLVWLLLGFALGFTGSADRFLKLAALDYVLCMVLLVRYRQDPHSRGPLQDKQQHRDWQSLLAAVFDVFGELEWCAGPLEAKPQLCFPHKPNSTLDELLQRPMAGQPLEVLLGPEPMAPEDQSLWIRELQRLHTFVALEAGAKGKGQEGMAARKLPLTCRDVCGGAVEVELFLRRGADSSIVFGILAASAERTQTSNSSVHFDAAASWPRSAADGSCSHSMSGDAAGGDMLCPLPLQGATGRKDEELAWIDVATPEWPILNCTAGFAALLGCSSASGLQLKCRLSDASGFESWLRDGLCQALSLPSSSAGAQQVIGVKLQRDRAGSPGVEVQADCSSDFMVPYSERSFNSDIVPVLLSFSNITSCPDCTRDAHKGIHAALCSRLLLWLLPHQWNVLQSERVNA